MANSIYDDKYFTGAEKLAAEAARKAAERGETSWDDAHNYVENIRKRYGYSGGQDGSGYTALPGELAKPVYRSDDDDAYRSMLLKSLDTSYDKWAQGDEYNALRERWAKNGKRAMTDTLGELSTRTGGLASSYAGSAAQQEYDRYMEGLEDAARKRYDADRAEQLEKVNMLRDLADNGYARYRDEMGQFNTDRSFAYQRDLDDEARKRAEQQDEQNAALLAAQYGDYSKLNEMGIDTGDNPQDFERKFTLAQLAAQYGDYSGLRALGIEPDIQPKASGGSTGGTRKYYDGGNDEGDGGLGLDAASIAQLRDYYGGMELSEQQWNEILTQNPNVSAEMLSAAGFTQKKSKVDTNSILQLGYGPIGPEKLDELIRSGKVEEYQDGSVIKFRKKETAKKKTADPFHVPKLGQ